MDNRGEDEHEEELDFHLGTADDSSSDDENVVEFKFIINGKGCWWGCTKRCTGKLSIWLPIYFISIVGLWQLVL